MCILVAVGPQAHIAGRESPPSARRALEAITSVDKAAGMTGRRTRIVPGPDLLVIDARICTSGDHGPREGRSPAISRRGAPGHDGRGPAAELDRLVGGFALAATADAPRGLRVVVATRHAEASIHGLLTAGGRGWVPRIARPTQGPSMIAWCAFPARPHDKPPPRAPIACLAVAPAHRRITRAGKGPAGGSAGVGLPAVRRLLAIQARVCTPGDHGHEERRSAGPGRARAPGRGTTIGGSRGRGALRPARGTPIRGPRAQGASRPGDER